MIEMWDKVAGQSSQFWVVTLQYIYNFTIQCLFVEVVHFTVTVNNLS